MSRDEDIREVFADFRRRTFDTSEAAPDLAVPTLADLLAAEPPPAVVMHPNDFARLVRRTKETP